MLMSKRIFGFASVALFATVLVGCDDQHLIGIPQEGAAPVAIITGEQSYDPLATAAFDGSTSYAASPKTIVSYAWAITQRPNGSASQIVSGSAPSNITFFVDLAGSYTVELTVTDSVGMTGSTQYAFNCVPSQGLHVELTWANQYTQADMDLHVVNLTQDPALGVLFDMQGCTTSGSTIATGSGCDCHWENCQSFAGEALDWFVVNVAQDDASQDIDNIDANTPENINIVKPVAGKYEVEVHYYSAEGGPSINVDTTVNVYSGGALTWTGTQTFTTINQVWDAGTVTVAANGDGSFAPKSTTLTNCVMPASNGAGGAGLPCNGVGP